ncbi:g11391 [Coccomyxa viridis]|uniref:G11391 protein n=1 Tax=Coccomyxa viridis TaxID=1274662 RepID=A0ABP1G7V5_9CHLO
MSTKRKYGIGKSWEKEEEKLCRAVKRLHTTSGNTEISPSSSSEDDVGSPFSQAAGHAGQAQKEAAQPSLRRAESGPGPSGSLPQPDSSRPVSPAALRRKQSLNRSRSGSSPPSRMSLGRSRGSREDTPDPRAAPPEYSGPSPTDKLSQEPSPSQSQPSSLRRYRRPASSAPLDIPLSQECAQRPLLPGSSPTSATVAQGSAPPNGAQPSIPEHAQTAESRSSVSSQAQPEQGAPTGSKWTLKFRPAPHDPGAFSRAAARSLPAIPAKVAGQAGSSTQPPGTDSGGASRVDTAQALPDAAGLQSRLSNVHLSGGASSGSADIEEPLTPGRTERSTGTSAQQRSTLQSGQSSFDSMYEEANNMLKNMHFQRLMRHCPNSPEPAEKGTRSMS